MELTSINEISLHTTTMPLGSVKAVYTERADYHQEFGRWVEGPRRLEEVFTFNHQGKIVEFTDYEKGFIRRKYTDTFDSNGNLSESIAFNADGSVEYRTIYTNDSLGKRSSFVIYGTDDSLVETWDYTYDTGGTVSAITAHCSDGSLVVTNFFSNDGVLTRKAVEYSSDGCIKRSSVEVRDFNRRVLERSNYDADNSLDSKWVWFYDAEGKETVRYGYQGDGSLDRKLVWAHDRGGEIIKTTEYSAQGKMEEERSYSYDFDEVGNWIKKGMQMLILGSEPPQYRPGPVIYRTFTYWPE